MKRIGLAILAATFVSLFGIDANAQGAAVTAPGGAPAASPSSTTGGHKGLLRRRRRPLRNLIKKSMGKSTSTSSTAAH